MPPGLVFYCNMFYIVVHVLSSQKNTQAKFYSLSNHTVMLKVGKRLHTEESAKEQVVNRGTPLNCYNNSI